MGLLPEFIGEAISELRGVFLFRPPPVFGYPKLLICPFPVQAARLLGWSFINEPYAAPSLQLLNGPDLGFVAGQRGLCSAKEIAPVCLETTAQGLLSGIYFGSMVGALAGGLLY